MSPSLESLSSMSDLVESPDVSFAALSESLACLLLVLDLSCVLQCFRLGLVGASLVLLLKVLLSDHNHLVLHDDCCEERAVALALAFDAVGAMVVGK